MISAHLAVLLQEKESLPENSGVTENGATSFDVCGFKKCWRSFVRFLQLDKDWPYDE